MALVVVVAVVEAKTVERIARNLPDCTIRLGKRPTLCDIILRVDQNDSLELNESAIISARKVCIVCNSPFAGTLNALSPDSSPLPFRGVDGELRPCVETERLEEVKSGTSSAAEPW